MVGAIFVKLCNILVTGWEAFRKEKALGVGNDGGRGRSEQDKFVPIDE